MSSDDEVHLATRELSFGEIHGGFSGRTQRAVLDVLHDADHFVFVAGPETPTQRTNAAYRLNDSFADGVLSGPEFARHRFVDDDYRRRLCIVLRGEDPPRDQRNPQRVEIAFISDVELRLGRVCRRDRRVGELKRNSPSWLERKEVRRASAGEL